jgi:hypothetical protein
LPLIEQHFVVAARKAKEIRGQDSFDLDSMKKCCAEFIGTFALVFAGTGAIIINDVSGGALTHVGISLTFGLIVAQWIKHWIQSEQRRSERPATGRHGDQDG